MAKRYLLVEVAANQPIKLLKKVDEAGRIVALTEKEPTHQLWSVSSWAEGIKQIKKYNETIGLSPNQIPRGVQQNIADQIKIWDWSKVSLDNKENIISWHAEKDFLKIFILHNSLKLTTDNYCCDGFRRHVNYNIQKAKEDGIV